MNDKALWIYGSGAHARKVCQAARAAGWSVCGLVDDAMIACSPFADVPLFLSSELPRARPDQAIFVAIGHPDVRRRLFERLDGEGWTIATVIHPQAWVAPDAIIGAGVVVAAGAVVETRADVGRGAIVDIGVLVDHDCRIGEFCHLRPGRVLQPASVVPSVPFGGEPTGPGVPSEA